jgi:hypothetical protein
MRYFEGLGKSHYRAASDHRLAQRYAMSKVLNTLAERFQTTRLALNDISERLFSIGDPPVDQLLFDKGAN